MVSSPSQPVFLWLQVVTALQTVLLLATLARAFRNNRTYPAMRLYLLLNALSGVLACAFFAYPHLLAGNQAQVFGALFWGVYGASGVSIFLTAQQIFRDVLAPFPGLRRLALVAFQWVAIVSAGVCAIPAVFTWIFHAQPLQITLLQAMRSVSVLELFLLAFVVVSARALGIRLRSRIVGVTAGFGVLAIVDTVCFIVLLHAGRILMPWVLVHELASAVSVGIWLAFLLRKDPQPQAGALPAASQWQKWNEIALALGKPAPHIALGPPSASPLFLQNVEGVVDRVLRRNAVNPSGHE